LGYSKMKSVSIFCADWPKSGGLLLTDSDGAGFVIRNYLKGAVDPSQVKHAYIPDRPGKEKRKRKPGKEGKLGVEGMSPQMLVEALRRGGATFLGEAEATRRPVTKADLFSAGLSGTPEASSRRAALLKALDLPERLSPNAMLEVLNALYGYGGLAELGLLGKREELE
jgi:ribonuclease M5